MKKIRTYALALSILVFMCSFLYIKKENEANREADKVRGMKITAVAVNQDVRPNTRLTEDLLTTKQFVVPEGDTDYFTNIDDVKGRIAMTDIFKGEKVTSVRSAKEGSEKLSLASHIGKGMRAVTITVGAEDGLAYNLRVGNRVDLLYGDTIEEEDIPAGLYMDAKYGEGELANSVVMDNEEGEQYVAIGLQNLRIAAIDSKLYYDSSESVEYSNITLEVSPKEALKIELLKYRGNPIYLMLRPYGDEDYINNPREVTIIKRADIEKLEKEKKDLEKESQKKEDSKESEKKSKKEKK